jgi:hypothetical protein
MKNPLTTVQASYWLTTGYRVPFPLTSELTSWSLGHSFMCPGCLISMTSLEQTGQVSIVVVLTSLSAKIRGAERPKWFNVVPHVGLLVPISQLSIAIPVRSKLIKTKLFKSGYDLCNHGVRSTAVSLLKAFRELVFCRIIKGLVVSRVHRSLRMAVEEVGSLLLRWLFCLASKGNTAMVPRSQEKLSKCRQC